MIDAATRQRIESALPHATAAQGVHLRAWLEHGSATAAAEALGHAPGAVSMSLTRATRRAEGARLDVEAPQPEGQVIAGVSTLYALPQPDEQGRVLRWVKTSRARETVRELAEAAREALQDVPAITPAPAPSHASAINGARQRLAVYAFGDPHFGMYADARETGAADYDTRIAAELHRTAFGRMLAACPAADRAVIVSVGDTVHADGRHWSTSRSGHPLDGDGRAWSVYREAVKSFAAMADAALEEHTAVEVVIVPGNHDDYTAHTIAEALRQRYRHEPRCTISDFSGGYTHFVEFDRVLLGFFHGHGARAKLADFGEMAHCHPAWSASRLRHGYSGHIHTTRVVEGRGWTAESLQTLAPVDAWAAEQGYGAGRSARLDVYHARGVRELSRWVTAEEIEG